MNRFTSDEGPHTGLKLMSMRLRLTAVPLLILLAHAVVAQNSSPQSSAVIRGTVTHKGRPIERARVTAVSLGSIERSALTAADGSYTITGLSEGVYLVRAAHRVYVAEESDLPGGGRLVEVGASNHEKIDFSLVAAGVLTGVIVDASGQPVPALRVSGSRIDGRSAPSFHSDREVMTDDEGRFRLYGLHPGEYRVRAGEQDGSIGKPSSPFRRSFYPGVEEPGRAALYRIGPGEVIDLGRLEVRTARPTFIAELLFRTAETQDPLPGYEFDLLTTAAGRMVRETFKTDELGRARIENLGGGRYILLPAVKNRGTSRPPGFAPTTFEVTDADVRDLVIICDTETVSFSGQVSLADGRPATGLDCTLALKEGEDIAATERPTYQIRLSPDGRFHLSGLRRVVYTLVILPLRPALRFEYAEVGDRIVRDPGYYGRLRLDAEAGPQAIRIKLTEISR